MKISPTVSTPVSFDPTASSVSRPATRWFFEGPLLGARGNTESASAVKRITSVSGRRDGRGTTDNATGWSA
jgi:hypothetical protein